MEARSLARASGGLTVPRSRKLLGAFGDDRLVEQLRRGNDVAFEVLYDRHHKGVLSYCRHMLGSPDEAEDALQQAFISAHSDIVATGKPIRFKAWIYTIARNRCLSMLRARREQPSDDLERLSIVGLGDEVQQRADLRQLLVDLRELPEDQRAALILSELGDLSHFDVAEVIGCEVAKVKSLVFQARSGLIERRQARETPCEDIREQLSTLRGGSLRRGPLRRHLKACPGCSEFRDEVRRQRKMVAAVLPVIPTLGLKESALAAVGVGAASAGGGLVAGGGAGAVIVAKTGAVKLAAVALATGGIVGGGVAVQQGSGAAEPRPSAVERSQPGVVTDAGAVDSRTPAANAPGDSTSRDDAKDRNGTAEGRGEPARAERGKERSGRTRGRDRAAGRGRSDGATGFLPQPGASNGERARDFARGRGEGRKLGLDKQSARGDAKGSGRENARSGQKPSPREQERARSPRRDRPDAPERRSTPERRAPGTAPQALEPPSRPRSPKQAAGGGASRPSHGRPAAPQRRPGA